MRKSCFFMFWYLKMKRFGVYNRRYRKRRKKSEIKAALRTREMM